MSAWDAATARWRALARREVADRLYAEKQRASESAKTPNANSNEAKETKR